MALHARFDLARLYAVEISGWDCAEEFFVEKCELEWNEESGKLIVLKRALNDNAVLLVRLLQTGNADRSHPVVFKAAYVGQTESGLHQFRLNPVVPRRREEEGPQPIWSGKFERA
jgi:hypothetical protein